MADEQYQKDLMRYLDGEMAEEERAAFRRRIEQNPDLASDLHELELICRLADEVTFAEPDREVWDRYWKGVSARTQRGAGWSLTALGMAILISAALTWFFSDPAVPPSCKIGGALFLTGLAILFFTVLIARIKTLAHDKYRRIER